MDSFGISSVHLPSKSHASPRRPPQRSSKSLLHPIPHCHPERSEGPASSLALAVAVALALTVAVAVVLACCIPKVHRISFLSKILRKIIGEGGYPVRRTRPNPGRSRIGTLLATCVTAKSRVRPAQLWSIQRKTSSGFTRQFFAQVQPPAHRRRRGKPLGNIHRSR